MKHYLSLFILLFVSLATFAQERDEACKFENFIYEAEVHADNTWDVHETITANFLEPRHGIFQYIELYYSDILDGNDYKYATSVKNVNVSGFHFEEKFEDGTKYKVIRIGDEDTTVSGEVTYNINYTLEFPDDRYPKGDILYASILGAQWKNDIDIFRFSIHFEKPLPADFENNMRVISGELGSEDNALNVVYSVDWAKNTIVGTVTGINHHNAVTLRANLPEGYWETSSKDMTKTNNFSLNLFYASIALFVITLLYILKNRRRKPLVVIEYGAPDGISSAEVGFIVDNTADLSDLTSLIVWWASKGYLKIEEEEEEKTTLGVFKKKKKKITLHKLAELSGDAPEYQALFWDLLFEDSGTVCQLDDLGDKSAEISAALRALKNNYKDDKKLVTINRKAVLLVGLYMLCSSFAILLSSKVEAFYDDVLVVIFAWICSVFGYGFWLFKNSEKPFKEFVDESKLKRGFALLIMVILCWSTLAMASETYDPINNILPQYGAAAIIAGGWVFLLLVRNLRQDTPYRIELMSRLLGFKEFIRSAELPMLKAMVDENPSFFYDVLPYALAFGLSDKWCEQFAEIDVKEPDWYTTNQPDPLFARSGVLMARGLVDVFDNEISNSIRSSSIDRLSGGSSFSSSGGGFSGGGGGGGGGGSW